MNVDDLRRIQLEEISQGQRRASALRLAARARVTEGSR